MAILGSVFLGTSGNYNICGVNIEFENKHEGEDVFGNNFFGRAVECLLSCTIVNILTLGYLHVFIHEMGHALASKINGKCDVNVNIYTNKCRGDSVTDNSMFSRLAGPILGMLWEIAKIASAIAITIFFPTPLGLSAGIFLGAGGAFWLFGEVMYACSGNGDWDC